VAISLCQIDALLLPTTGLSRTGVRRWGIERSHPRQCQDAGQAQQRAAAPTAIHQSPRQIVELVPVHAVFSFLFGSDPQRDQKTLSTSVAIERKRPRRPPR
jgi:hypothetical protein